METLHASGIGSESTEGGAPAATIGGPPGARRIAGVILLPHGVCAVLATEPLEPDAAPVPSPAAKRYRWAKNDHYWQDCACPECAGRRAGTVPSGYTTIEKADAKKAARKTRSGSA